MYIETEDNKYTLIDNFTFTSIKKFLLQISFSLILLVLFPLAT